MSDFEKGFKFVSENLSSSVGNIHIDNWLNEYESGYDEFIQNIIDIAQGSNAKSNIKQGDVFEAVTKGSFNQTAIGKGSNNHAFIPRSHELGSADVITDKGRQAQLKSYSDSSRLIRAIAETPKERYYYLVAKAEREGRTFMSQSEYCIKNNIDPKDFNRPIYKGQDIIVNGDMYDKAMIDLNKKIQIALANGDFEKATRYQEVKDTLNIVLREGKIASVPMTHEELVKITKYAEKGQYDKIRDFFEKEKGLNLNELVTSEVIAKQALQAGLNAAILSLVITIAPTILSAFSQLINEGEINPKTFAELGYKSLNGSAKGFINGSISAAIVTCCRAGKFGADLVNANGNVITAMVTLAICSIELSIKCATGKIDKTQMVEEMCRLYVVTGFSLGTGMLASTAASMIPFMQSLTTFAYMIGSFVGGLIGNFVFDISKQLFISLCVERGLTFFGLVEQNYTLPDEVLNIIGIDKFEFKMFEFDEFEYDEFSYTQFDFNEFKYDRFEITPLKRGVIAVNRIAYL